MATRDELSEVLRAEMDRCGVPGAAIGILVGGDVVVATHGVSNVEFPRPVSERTLFQVGSISKTFTAAAIMLLVQHGTLRLDDSVSLHLPDLKAATGIDFDAVTVEQLLSHQSGFDGDHLFVERAGNDLAALRGARILFPPGEGYSYSNAGFSVAGAVVEAVSGERFDRFIGSRLLRPLAMLSATYRADEAVTYDVAAPHWVFEGAPHVIRGAGWQPGWELAHLDWAPGGLIASLDHLLAWCRFQGDGRVIGGNEVLCATSLARLHTPVITNGMQDQIALDWFVREIDGATTIGHGGVTAGYVSDLLIVPERSFAFVALTNATNGAELIAEVRRWALERFAGLHETDPVPDLTADPDVDRVIGRYVHAFAVLEVTAGIDPGTVVITSNRREGVTGWQPPLDPPRACALTSGDSVVTCDGERPVSLGTFGTPTNGPAAWLNWKERRAPRLSDVDAPVATGAT